MASLSVQDRCTSASVFWTVNDTSFVPCLVPVSNLVPVATMSRALEVKSLEPSTDRERFGRTAASLKFRRIMPLWKLSWSEICSDLLCLKISRILASGI